MSRIAVVGTGYVGLTTGACLAQLGHDVVCADIDEEKVEALSKGEIPIVEAGLEQLVAGRAADRVGCASSSALPTRAADAEFVYLCVPTPQGADGSADLSLHRGRRRRDRATSSTKGAVVVNKSTVPVGSTKVVERVLRRPDVSVVSNPEFLREGTAVHDFLHPDRIVVGSRRPAAPPSGSPSLYLGVAGPVHRHRSGLGRDDQVRRQRLPRHEDVLHQRHRRRVRGTWAPTWPTSCWVSARTSASAMIS